MAYKLNTTMDQGSDFLCSFTVSHANGSVFDLSGYTAASQMRKHADSEEAININVGLSANGMVELYLASSNTELIEQGRYYYDAEVEDSYGNRYRIVEGLITVTPNMTR